MSLLLGGFTWLEHPLLADESVILKLGVWYFRWLVIQVTAVFLVEAIKMEKTDTKPYKTYSFAWDGDAGSSTWVCLTKGYPLI